MISSVTVFIPAYNEGNTIYSVVSQTLKFLRNKGLDFEIILLNDASTDNTLSVMKNLSSYNKEVIFKNFKRKQGLGRLMKQGYRMASKDWVIMISGDGEFNPADFNLYFNNSEKADIVSGNRLSRLKIYNLQRKAITLIFNFLVRFLFGIPINDAGSSKLIRKKIIESIVLKSSGIAVEVEILVKSCFKGFKFIEVETPFTSRKEGRSKAFNLQIMFTSLFWILILYFYRVFYKFYKSRNSKP